MKIFGKSAREKRSSEDEAMEKWQANLRNFIEAKCRKIDEANYDKFKKDPRRKHSEREERLLYARCLTDTMAETSFFTGEVLNALMVGKHPLVKNCSCFGEPVFLIDNTTNPAMYRIHCFQCGLYVNHWKEDRCLEIWNAHYVDSIQEAMDIDAFWEMI